MKSSMVLALVGAASSALAAPTKVSESEPTLTRRQFEDPLPTDYASYMVYYHNMHRFNHTAPSVVWDQGLADAAASHPYKCGDLVHYNPGYGQNLAAFGATNIDETYGAANAGGMALSGWYSENVNWDPAGYGSADPYPSLNGGEILHFTQVVWAGSLSIGCDTSYCPDYYGPGYNGYYTTCNYSPQGNYGGEYGNNVLYPAEAMEPYYWEYDPSITY